MRSATFGERRHHAVGGVHESLSSIAAASAASSPDAILAAARFGGRCDCAAAATSGSMDDAPRGGEGVHLGEHRRPTRRDVARRVRDVPGPRAEIAVSQSRRVGSAGAEPHGGVSQGVAERVGVGAAEQRGALRRLHRLAGKPGSMALAAAAEASASILMSIAARLSAGISSSIAATVVGP